MELIHIRRDKIAKVLKRSGKCVWGAAYAGLTLTAKALTGPYSKMQPELQTKDIVDTVSFLVKSEVEGI